MVKGYHGCGLLHGGFSRVSFFLTGQSNIADLTFFALVIVELDTTYISTSCPVAMLLTVPREKITSCCYFLVTVAQKPHQPNMVKNQLQT